jgi:hypothetical protein
MLKQFSICAALVAYCAGVVGLAAGSASVQQQEAILQAIEVPGAAFDLMVAVPKMPAATVNLERSPEALVMHLAGGRLVLTFETAEQMLRVFDSLQRPVGAFYTPDTSGNGRVPVTVYLVPKANTLASAAK